MFPLLLACSCSGPALDSVVDTDPVDPVVDSDLPDSAPETGHTGDSGPSTPLNVLLLVLDDVGIDKVGAYGVHDEAPPTPTLDALAAEGLLFENAWAYPGCTPTRAAMLTGRHAARTGLGMVLTPQVDSHWLLGQEVTLPEMLAEAGYTSAAVGKWHLVGWAHGAATMHPMEQGFSHFRGLMGNLHHVLSEPAEDVNYTYWQKTTDGKLSWETDYVTSVQADDVVALTEELPEPWFLYAGFTAAHEPYDLPPDELTTLDVTSDSAASERFDAIVEAVDAEIGRLLSEVEPEVLERTLVVVLGDNGTPRDAVVASASEDRTKESLFDGGVNIPLVVVGPGVVTGRTDALVHIVDFFPTFAELAGVDLSTLVRTEGDHAGEPVTLDGSSWLPVLGGAEGTRSLMLSERLQPISPGAYDEVDVTVRNAGYKLLRTDAIGTPSDLLFRYAEGQYAEGEDLSGQLGTDDALDAAYAELTAEVERYLDEVTYGP